jgi:hypothetical protein
MVLHNIRSLGFDLITSNTQLSCTFRALHRVGEKVHEKVARIAEQMRASQCELLGLWHNVVSNKPHG